MFRKLNNILWTCILEKYILKDINISSFLIYQSIYEFLFKNKLEKNILYLTFLEKNTNKSYTIEILFKKEKIELIIDEELEDLKKYLNTNIEKFLKETPNDFKEDYFYLFFSSFFDEKEYKDLKKSHNYEISYINKEWQKNYERSHIIVTQKNTIIKEIKWINSIHWISNIDFFKNMIFLKKNWYLNNFGYRNSVLYYEMPYFIWEKKVSYKEIVDYLIIFNNLNYIWDYKWLWVCLIQEDTNIDNFIKITDNKIRIIDFEDVTNSFIILQPIYIFLSFVLYSNNLYDREKLLVFLKYTFKKYLDNKIFYRDFNTLKPFLLFEFYKKIYLIWITKNSQWVNIKEDLIYFFDNNKEQIIKIILSFKK